MPFGIFSYQTKSGLMVIGAEQTGVRPARGVICARRIDLIPLRWFRLARTLDRMGSVGSVARAPLELHAYLG